MRLLVGFLIDQQTPLAERRLHYDVMSSTMFAARTGGSPLDCNLLREALFKGSFFTSRREIIDVGLRKREKHSACR